jgi:hypothetical protein
MCLPHTGFDMGNMAGVLQEAEVAYSYGAPESTHGFWWGPCFGLIYIVLRSSSVVLDFHSFEYFLDLTLCIALVDFSCLHAISP